jgi:SH3 domain protein
MKNKLAFFFLLLLSSGFVSAKTVYVTDNMTVNVKADDSDDSAILSTVTSGTPLILLSKKRSSEYAKIRLASGDVGYVLKSYLNEEPVNKFYLEKTNQELAKLKQEHAQVQAELAAIKKAGSNAITEALVKERNKLVIQLDELRLISADAVEVRKQRDSLQENFIKLNKELEQLKLEKQTLETSSNQDWFMYGGLLSLFGVLLGYILPKLSWRRKSHNWDTF